MLREAIAAGMLIRAITRVRSCPQDPAETLWGDKRVYHNHAGAKDESSLPAVLLKLTLACLLERLRKITDDQAKQDACDCPGDLRVLSPSS